MLWLLIVVLLILAIGGPAYSPGLHYSIPGGLITLILILVVLRLAGLI